MHRYCFQAHAGHLNANLWSLYHQVGCITLAGENRVQTTASSADNSPFPKDRRRLIMLASVPKFGAYIFLFGRPDMLENTTCSNSQSE